MSTNKFGRKHTQETFTVAPSLGEVIGLVSNSGKDSFLSAGVADNAITAFAGGGQASAVQLNYRMSRVTTVGTAADSVKLPKAQAGMSMVVMNAAAANSMNIFPSSGEAINALSADTAIALAANKTMLFVCAVNGTWMTILTA